jgi:gamma-butyrobetaine dioxygenase
MDGSQGGVEVTVSADRRRLKVRWPDGRAVDAPAPWLFDNAEDAFDPGSGHRLRGARDLDVAREVLEARLDGEAIAVRFGPGGEARRVALAAFAPAPPAPAGRELWTSPQDVARLADVPFAAYLADDAALAEALGRLARLGLVFLAGAGTEPGTVERAVARFGHVRETNYGRLFDVRDDPAAGHLAYTTRGLELHTDNPYREPVPTLQALHVIAAADDGGESQFADGFAHAAALADAAPARYDTLTWSPVTFAYRGPAGDRYEARAPVIETDIGDEVIGVRVNHRSLRPLDPASDAVEAWYEAYLDFHHRLHADPLARKLAPGDLVLFDNRRIVHGRAPYAGGAAARWLQGCYAERDGALATLARLTDAEAGR